MQTLDAKTASALEIGRSGALLLRPDGQELLRASTLDTTLRIPRRLTPA
jgi:hypothetical protein